MRLRDRGRSSAGVQPVGSSAGRRLRPRSAVRHGRHRIRGGPEPVPRHAGRVSPSFGRRRGHPNAGGAGLPGAHPTDERRAARAAGPGQAHRRAARHDHASRAAQALRRGIGDLRHLRCRAGRHRTHPARRHGSRRRCRAADRPPAGPRRGMGRGLVPAEIRRGIAVPGRSRVPVPRASPRPRHQSDRARSWTAPRPRNCSA